MLFKPEDTPATASFGFLVEKMEFNSSSGSASALAVAAVADDVWPSAADVCCPCCFSLLPSVPSPEPPVKSSFLLRSSSIASWLAVDLSLLGETVVDEKYNNLFPWSFRLGKQEIRRRSKL